MKKVFLLMALFGACSFSAIGKDAYRLDEVAVEQAFAQATDLSFTVENQELIASALGTAAGIAAVPAEGDQTKFGFLVRAYFCGFIGLHRSYMGTNGKDLWYMYLCIPVYGPIVTFVDFWGVVFGALDYTSYKNNSKFNVWWGK